MSISSKLEKLAADITSAYSAVNTKGGTIPSNKNTENLANAITSIPQGGGSSVEGKDVNFYDYDGTLTNSYTKTEFLALSALPENPTHAGLTAQGWNWSLSDAKTYVTSYGMLDIGQNYVTDDDKTRIYVTLDDDDFLSPHIRIGLNGSITIDWGDGSNDTATGNNTAVMTDITHTYSSTGDYIIKITRDTNATQIAIVGDTWYYCRLLTDANYGRTYQVYIKKVELGSNVTLGDYAFYGCYYLETITIPNTITNFGTNGTFQYCSVLKGLTIPSGTTTIPQYFVYHSDLLKNVPMPKSITTINQYAFCYCSLLTRLMFSDNITSLSGTICINNPNLEVIVFPNSITTLSATSSSNTKVKKIILPNNITSLPSSICYGCTTLKEINIPSGVTSIGTQAFYSCAALKKVTIPNGITSIESMTFASCVGLMEIIIPNSVTTIKSSGFSSCYSLLNLEIPGSVTSIENNAFQRCMSLQYVDFTHHTSIPTLGSSTAFTSTNNCPIIVPDDLYENWIAATNWSSLSSRIVKASEV